MRERGRDELSGGQTGIKTIENRVKSVQIVYKLCVKSVLFCSFLNHANMRNLSKKAACAECEVNMKEWQVHMAAPKNHPEWLFVM